ncbi:ATP-binding cassette domain-containing protein [Sphingomonadaceae bacterium jetA1]|jgi:ATP-binding cassette subfamily C protein CydC|uniref:amino acid ABC transporter ATP-binding/permease protein n=1 Tax=Facivitalis istanbulensis TaxID=3075838 RepID=UPI003479D128
MTRFATLLRREIRRERKMLGRAALLAAIVTAATVILLGLSGWFITAAGAAGLAGPLVARAFNYMLPSATIRLLAILRTGARYGERLASHAAAFAILARIRPALYRAIAAAPPARSLALTSGEASARLVQDVAAVEMAIARRSTWAGAIAAVASGAALGGMASPAAALAIILLASATLAGGFHLLAGLAAPGRDGQRLQGELRALLSIQLAAAPELRCYAMEQQAGAAILAIETRLSDARQRQAMVAGLVEGLSAAVTALAAVAAFLFALPSGAALAALAALAAATTVDGLAPLLRHRAAHGATQEAEARLADLFEQDAPPAPCPVSPVLTLPGIGTLPPEGARIAITGASGTGKTSLVEALVGLRTDQGSGWAIGGAMLDTLNAATLRPLFAWAPQDAQLLAGTVRENLRLARPDATDDVLWTALDDAALAEVVRALPQGLDSWIGEDGARLSGGERRRLSLARAYLADAPWLLLDEPTEALDAKTEERVLARLDARLARSRQGLIVVSHRPALLASCPWQYAVRGDASRARRSDRHVSTAV